MEMTSVADSLKRCPERASILFIGSTGDGKSATINHLLNTDQVVPKTGSFEPETRATLEYLVTVTDHDNEASNLKLGIIDTPGVNDPRGIKQDACNLNSMKHFFETHPLYSKHPLYPNLIFLVVSANEHRIDGGNSGLANTLRVLKELNVVDQRRPNIVAVVTFSCSVSYRKITRWQEILEGKKGIISRNICQALGVLPPVVLLENDRDSNQLEKDGDFTLLPNGERQPENLYKVCQNVLKDNEDHYGLSTFNACLVKPDTEKQYEVSYHKVLATDSSKNPISEVEQDYLNVLRGGTKDGKEIMRNITSGRERKDRPKTPMEVVVYLLWCVWLLLLSLLSLLPWLLDKTLLLLSPLLLWLLDKLRLLLLLLSSWLPSSRVRPSEA